MQNITHGHISVDWAAKLTFIISVQIKSTFLNDLPRTMTNRDGFREKFKVIATVAFLDDNDDDDDENLYTNYLY